MKVVILAGGFGTRLSEETLLTPKPMIQIGEKPIIWHIMKIYSHYGFNEFIICLGYKGYMIKEYFHHYLLYQSDSMINLSNNEVKYFNQKTDPWTIYLIDTGLNTITGGRIKRIKEYVNNEPFMATYGDGVADIRIDKLLDFHEKKGKIATLTAVQPSGRFGAIDVDEKDDVLKFQEKPRGDNAWINGGFYVFSPEIFNYIEGDLTHLEGEPLENLAKENQLSAYKHDGFWRPMDTLRDKNELERLWASEKPPWKIWKAKGKR